MCTAISFRSKDHYFGRNLDLPYHYRESVTVTPRKYLFQFSDGQKTDSHYAIIGIASVFHNYPLYYDATNECGLSVAALNFPGNARYKKRRSDCVNIASYELIPWLLAQCQNVGAVKNALSGLNITNDAFSEQLQPTPLHWMISDLDASLVLEVTDEGLRLYDNPVNVLTNNPPFPYHLHNLANYMGITAQEPENRFASSLQLLPYSVGMGGIGLPGDLSSASRFVRAAFHLHNAVTDGTEKVSVNQFFHILGSVYQCEGCVAFDNMLEKTVYSSCCNTTRGIYYYTTYENSQITAIDMHHEDLDSSILVSYPLKTEAQYLYEN